MQQRMSAAAAAAAAMDNSYLGRLITERNFSLFQSPANTAITA